MFTRRTIDLSKRLEEAVAPRETVAAATPLPAPEPPPPVPEPAPLPTQELPAYSAPAPATAPVTAPGVAPEHIPHQVRGRRSREREGGRYHLRISTPDPSDGGIATSHLPSPHLPSPPLPSPPPAAPPPPAPPPLALGADPTESVHLARARTLAANTSGPAGTQGAQRVLEGLYHTVRDKIYSKLNVSAALTLGRERVRGAISEHVAIVCSDARLPATASDQEAIVAMVLDDMFGVGPIEPLLADPSVTDILVNGPYQVYVERSGRLDLTDVRFRDDQHVVAVAQRIASSIGRRVDESSPMVDARLADGSRVNVILPPLALDGACISIRKFSKRRVGFEEMIPLGTISPNAAKMLEIAGACRLNIIISGGTGSGKTTMMNAISRKISPRERIVTIEDAAELQLQQPHVVRLETRAATAEGAGEVSMRDLVRNALRMRPDRIIIGECRGTEAFDLLQAMNTGHDGSMSTVHANTPRDALTRLENMVLMSNGNLPVLAIRQQIAGAVNLIVQVERMRDGVRRTTYVTEVVGIESDVIITQDLFWFEFDMAADDDRLVGRFKSSGIRPHFIKRAAMFGLADAVMEAMR